MRDLQEQSKMKLILIITDFKMNKDENYLNPLVFWKEYQQLFLHLVKLACHTISISCVSAVIERKFSTADQVVNQRRSNLDLSNIDDILFLRPTDNNKKTANR